MSTELLIVDYFDLKSKNEITKTEIREELAANYNYTPEEIKAIMIEISNRELNALQNQKTPIEKLLSSIFVSYFFLAFGLHVICISIFILNAEITNSLNKTLPWILISGAVFMIYKHGTIINSYRKQKINPLIAPIFHSDSAGVKIKCNFATKFIY
ncbi:MAG: hypothetical protein P8I55_07260 [Crocinitomix sp.]|nr:hypothetical protein [Crocinitomix sp.]